ncbi:MAG TPA: CoA-transferase [Terriglobia bacterium]|nr:CoA-transferase [Terriglobia bacterium]
MAEIVTIDELAGRVSSGVRLGIGGVHFARLPIALIEKVLALGRKDFTFISWGGGLALELFLEAEAVRKLVFCFSSLDIFGLAPRFREALEKETIEVEEWSALAMIEGLKAAQFKLPEMPFQLPRGSDLMQHGDFWRESKSLFTGEPLGQARRLDVDVLLLHAQRADRDGNVEIQGARGLDLSMIGAAKQTLVTVEEIVETGEIGRAPRSFALPRTFVTAVACVPFGAYPTSCLPYYATDYGRLLAYMRAEQARRKAEASTNKPAKDSAPPRRDKLFMCEEPRKKFLAQAARFPASELTPERLGRHGLNIPENVPYTVDELLAVCLAREYDSFSICSVGSVSPLAMVSYLLAKRAHAPGLTLIALNGGFIEIDAHPMLLTLAEALEFQSAKVCWGGDETYHWYYQPGRITHEVITVAQIDVTGRTNNAWIEGHGKRLRLPGQGGMADVANLHKNFVLYLTRHSPERVVESVAFSTAARGLLKDADRLRAGLQPGKVRLISDLGIFELDPTEQRFRLVSIHPAVSLEEISRQTGGDLLIADPLPVTGPPSKEQVRLIRDEVDPFGIRRLEFVPGKERLALIESILRAEESLIRETAS